MYYIFILWSNIGTARKAGLALGFDSWWGETLWLDIPRSMTLIGLLSLLVFKKPNWFFCIIVIENTYSRKISRKLYCLKMIKIDYNILPRTDRWTEWGWTDWKTKLNKNMWKIQQVQKSPPPQWHFKVD